MHEQRGERAIIWDSLAIAEYLNELHPEVALWPRESSARAAARSLCSEMHSGFKALRSNMPMNLRRHYVDRARDDDTNQDIKRVCDLWHWTMKSWSGDGPFLFGEQFTAVDAFFTPVAARFRTYSVELDDISQAYTETLLSYPFTKAWYADALAETRVFEHCEFDED